MEVVSLYSFKGGSGRTTTTANLAGALSRKLENPQDKPVLIIDLDIDSAGLTMFFEQFVDGGFERNWTCIDILSGHKEIALPEDYNEMLEEGLEDISECLKLPQGSVYFLPSEKIGQEKTVVNDKTSLNAFKTLKLKSKENFSAILIDSASGRQETALLSHMVSDTIINFFRVTYQFQVGTKENIIFYIERCLRFGEEPPRFILLPNAVPKREKKWQKERYGSVIASNNKLLVNKLEDEYDVDCVFIEEGIPEIEQFKWKETILFQKQKANRTEEENEFIQKLEEISSILVEDNDE